MDDIEKSIRKKLGGKAKETVLDKAIPSKHSCCPKLTVKQRVIGFLVCLVLGIPILHLFTAQTFLNIILNIM